MSEIRQLTRDELVESIHLSAFAFQLTLTPEQVEERKALIDPTTSWGAFVDGELAAKMSILRLETWVNGRLFAMGGIAGVATWPEHRRQGLVKELLQHALRVMKEEGRTLSFLHPFEIGFYRKFGWEVFVDTKKYEIATKQLPGRSWDQGTVRGIKGSLSELTSLYESFAMKYNGMLKRSDIWWEKHYTRFKKGRAAVYYNAQDEARGYIYYEVKNREMTVHDLVWLDEEARRGLWRFISDHDSMINKVTVTAPASDALPFLLADPRIKQEVGPYFMARIVDTEAFLKQYVFDDAAEGERFELAIRDEHAPWNEGVYSIEIGAGGSARVLRLSDTGAAVRLACDIGTMTAMMMGYQKPVFLKEAGKLDSTKEAAEAWSRALPVRETYFADFF